MAKATEPAFSPLSLAAMFCVPAKCYADFEAAAMIIMERYKKLIEDLYRKAS
jgi:hypothetical protein